MLSKNYNPKEYEDKIYKKWSEKGVGKPENQTDTVSKSHCILMPPPNLTGNLHAGHAYGHYLMDTLSRVYRQRGQSTLWVPGVDHAGIQLEGVIDKMFKTGEADHVLTEQMKNHNEFPADKEDLPKFLKKHFRQDWLEFAWSKVDEWRDFQKNQAKILGDTPDYSRNLFTLDERAVEMVNFAFQKYWEDDLIYKKSYLINWSVGLQTALSDVQEDIGREKRKDPFVTIEYDVWIKGIAKPSGYKLAVQTVRPETIFADHFLMVNLESQNLDSELKEFLQENVDKVFVQLPLTNVYLPIQLTTDSSEVDPEFGTGALKVTPAHDPHDYDLFNKYKLKSFDMGSGQMEIRNPLEPVIGRDGKLTDLGGKFVGKTVEVARREMILELIKSGNVPIKENAEPNEKLDKQIAAYLKLSTEETAGYSKYNIDWNYEHNVTICERSKTVVEPLISEEFFLNYHKPTSRDNKTLSELGEQGIKETKYFSENFKQMGLNFVHKDNLNDWVISRDLVWGHKMPVWYNLENNPTRKFYTKSEYDSTPDANNSFRISNNKPKEDGNWVQETKILDTWFSSCLWPLSTLNYIDSTKNIDWDEIPKLIDDENKNDSDFWKYYSTDEMITAREIFYAWIVRMTILGKYFTGKIPFRTVLITPTVQDEKGRKMSKSLKNGIDPIEAIDNFSSDSLRLAMLGSMIPNRNVKMGGSLADRLLEKQRNFGNKLWNVARFLDSK